MENIKVSVVVPVYNVEKYVARTLDCLIGQTYNNLEIIAVDDGTKDNSGIICDQYAQKDARIMVCHKANGGVSSARNYGIAKSTGEYIYFLDGDDYIAPNAIELLLKCAVDTNSDIAICKMKKTYPKDKKTPWNKLKNKSAQELSSRDYKMLLTTGNTLDFCLLGTHLFKADLVKKCLFNTNLSQGEDLIFNFNVAETANKIAFLPMPLMAYFQRDGSAVNSKFSVRRFPLMNELLKIAEQNKKDEKLCNCIKTWLYYSALESFYFMMRDKIVDRESYVFLRDILKKHKSSLRKNKLAKLSRRIFAPIGVGLINMFIKKQNKKA